ncbi:GNAT family N-acetyltransferase [Bowmanella denitrificans]|uniref:GNAT family N-acetyltransferase n=1 Tax=Bowmanella denitrificans TaxID=366582 RepID=UPI0011AF986B|nr:GNAT family N-acetyltransferase [Bowmanella denitrificans]
MSEINIDCTDNLQLLTDYGQSCRASLIYTSSRYVGLITQHLHADACLLVASKGESITGILPFVIKGGTLGKVYNSMPFYGSNGGVLQRTPCAESKRALIQHFYTQAQSNNAASATIITNPLLEDNDDYERWSDYDFKDERIGQFTAFPDNVDEADLINLFESPRRRNIRKAIKSQVQVYATQKPEDMAFLYQTHKHNMDAIGGVAKHESFFQLVPELMNDQEWSMYIATIENKPVAGLLLLYYNATVEYFTPVIVEEYRNTQALALVIYEAMKQARVKGFKRWNWGGTWLTQDGVYSFKKKWGTQDLPYYYYTRLFNPETLKQQRQQLLSEYEGFFVLPFSQLEQS